MAQTALKMNARYTWDDYRTWPEGERYVFWKGFSHEDVLTSPGFPDLRIELAEVFALALQQHAGELTFAKEGPAHYKTG